MPRGNNWNESRIAIRATLQAVIIAAALQWCATAHAEIPFGFKFGMTKQATENAATAMGLGVSKWLGATLIVQAQDDPRHSYMFNFCQDKLFEVSQNFPLEFRKMADIVDDSIRQYGQPVFVSAQGAMTQNGFLRPINLYWKIDEASYVRLMQLEKQYNVIYQTENSCVKVPT